MPAKRLTVQKTYKLFINGKFPRSESGRTLPLEGAAEPVHYAHGSRKDLRDAVVAARKAQNGWSQATAYLKGQIVYRIAEMLETRADSFIDELVKGGSRPSDARKEVEAACDRLVYFAGWSDKFPAVASSVNPVASPHFNFTRPEATGVVGILCPSKPALLSVTTLLAAAIVSGNTVVMVLPEANPLPGLSLGEVLGVSDVPAGVVNLLSGQTSELVSHLASHMDVNAVVDATACPDRRGEIEREATSNLKRTWFPQWTGKEWFSRDPAALDSILATTEDKTTWHPVGV